MSNITHEEYKKRQAEILLELLPPSIALIGYPDDKPVSIDTHAKGRSRAAQQLDALLLEVVAGIESVNESNGRYNACAELRQIIRGTRDGA